MKAYTDIEQSKKLAEILIGDSADMCWGIDDDTLTWNTLPYLFPWRNYTAKEYYIPCWSLAALIALLPNGTILKKSDNGKYFIGGLLYDNLLDVCVDKIIELKKEISYEQRRKI